MTSATASGKVLEYVGICWNDWDYMCKIKDAAYLHITKVMSSRPMPSGGLRPAAPLETPGGKPKK